MSIRSLRNHLSRATGVSEIEADIAIRSMMIYIKEQLLLNGKFVLQNFGTFYVKEVKLKKARNPRTGETVMVPPKKVVRFKPAVQLRDLTANINRWQNEKEIEVEKLRKLAEML